VRVEVDERAAVAEVEEGLVSSPLKGAWGALL